MLAGMQPHLLTGDWFICLYVGFRQLPDPGQKFKRVTDVYTNQLFITDIAVCGTVVEKLNITYNINAVKGIQPFIVTNLSENTISTLVILQIYKYQI